ncbi:MAG TPA: copper homeostasis protein CutC [Gemmatimonadaceae bacterium]|nr:copper homeostasis protein CutC [Gemmatimonadaceae bacterium]
MSVLVEACVDSVASAAAAERGGARRLELCDNLDVGGTSPSVALVRAVKEAVAIPVFVMVRPRGGDFLFSPREHAAILASIPGLHAAGANGFVIGALTAEATVDEQQTRELVDACALSPVTFHKAFDIARDQAAELEALVRCGVSRVLTSGGAPTARDGVEALRALVRQAHGRIDVMAGGRVRAPNVREIVEGSGVREVHARCVGDEATIRGIVEAVAGV